MWLKKTKQTGEAGIERKRKRVVGGMQKLGLIGPHRQVRVWSGLDFTLNEPCRALNGGMTG